MTDKRMARLETILVKRVSESPKIKSLLAGATNIKEMYIPALLQLIHEEVDMRDAIHVSTVADMGIMKTALDGAVERIGALEKNFDDFKARPLSPKPGLVAMFFHFQIFIWMKHFC
jgi:hypothetical protein